MTAADAAHQEAQADLQRALNERNREMQLVDTARWHRRHDAELAADARTTPLKRATGR